jgi:hypothetical protein
MENIYQHLFFHTTQHRKQWQKVNCKYNFYIKFLSLYFNVQTYVLCILKYMTNNTVTYRQIILSHIDK